MLLRSCALAAALLALPVGAQSNADPGIDVRHGPLTALIPTEHDGFFPDGMTAMAMGTTSCNVGSVDVPWISTDYHCPGGVGCGGACGVMQDDHPVIAFLVGRERDGRFEQISGYSWVKHAFFALSDSQCDECQNPSDGSFLGVGCSDTYSHFNNGDDYWLGPAEEIDPWLGTWNPYGSFFDRGLPDVGAPQNADGRRSVCNTSSFGHLGHRVHVPDADLLEPSASYYFQGQYVIRGEPEALRDNNLRSREFVPEWAGSGWIFTMVPSSAKAGSILRRWSDATLVSAANGNEDGRVYAAMRVTGPEDGLYRYEVALHNRDAHRKVGALRLPVHADATVVGAGFRDVDRDDNNQWGFRRNGDELEWRTPRERANPLRWNSIYNFWFESDVAPVLGTASYAPFDPGPGADEVQLVGLPLPLQQDESVAGLGCSFGEPPVLGARWGPATAGGRPLSLEVSGNDPGAMVVPFVGTASSAIEFGGCGPLVGRTSGVGPFSLTPIHADARGRARLVWSIPDVPALGGVRVLVQAASQRAGGGPVAGRYDLSNGIAVRLGAVHAGL